MTCNSEPSLGLVDQYMEGMMVDCEGASILVGDCASLAPGPPLNTFNKKKMKHEM